MQLQLQLLCPDSDYDLLEAAIECLQDTFGEEMYQDISDMVLGRKLRSHAKSATTGITFISHTLIANMQASCGMCHAAGEEAGAHRCMHQRQQLCVCKDSSGGDAMTLCMSVLIRPADSGVCMFSPLANRCACF